MSTRSLRAPWMFLMVAPLLAPACVADEEDPCDEAGACVDEPAEPPPEPADRDRSKARACAVDAECDDGNDCTSDACDAAGRCRFTPADGLVLRMGDCVVITCQDRVAEPVLSERGTLCESDRVCDYEGRCVTCSSHMPCPDGYQCDAGACVAM